MSRMLVRIFDGCRDCLEFLFELVRSEKYLICQGNSALPLFVLTAMAEKSQEDALNDIIEPLAWMPGGHCGAQG